MVFHHNSIHIASYNRKAAANGLKITNDKRTHIRDQLQRLGSRFYSQNEFQKGEWVLKQRQKRHKHEPTFEGPFLVINKTEKNSYTLQGPNGLTLPGTYHISHLRPAFQYYGSPLRSIFDYSKAMGDEEREYFLGFWTDQLKRIKEDQ
ncbi:catalytic activity protein [[Candida] boidinii]|nr:catalytic activity protein [[Candida] boidinii]